jgi:hypothetical protein
MKKILPVLIVAILALVAVPAKADTSTCATTGSTYVPGYSCMIGPLTFSNFTFSSSTTGLYTALTLSNLTVTSITTSGNDGLTFTLDDAVNSTSNGTGGIDLALGFTVTDTTRSITDLGLNLTGGVSGTGSVQLSENFCTNGPVSMCTQGNAPLVVTDPPPNFSAEVNFAATSSVSVAKDLTVNTGSGPGTADASVFSQTFSQTVPESASLTLLGLGLLGLAVAKGSKLGQFSL